MADEKAHSDPAPAPTPDAGAVLSDGSANAILRDAKAATDKERNMTLWQGIKLYPKAIAWSILISTCIVMEGYDISLVNNFCKFPFPSEEVLHRRTVEISKTCSFLSDTPCRRV